MKLSSHVNSAGLDQLGGLMNLLTFFPPMGQLKMRCIYFIMPRTIEMHNFSKMLVNEYFLLNGEFLLELNQPYEDPEQQKSGVS